jgi:hypothetical protein
MARRIEPPDSLDFFPTPPWATRALAEYVLFRLGHGDCGPSVCLRPLLGGALVGENYFPVPMTVAEPAAGEGHMAEVLHEYFADVRASDVHDYGAGYTVGSYIGNGPDVIAREEVDWTITNPPFASAEQFIDVALDHSREGVAVLLRTGAVEGIDRYDSIYRNRPPAVIAQFVERVPMTRGRWDPRATTATSYAWFVWSSRIDVTPGQSKFVWIPPGCRERLTRPDDAARFAAWTVAPAGENAEPGQGVLL